MLPPSEHSCVHAICLLLCSQIATDEDSGVLLYKGDNDHIAMELYRGRLRVSYDTGSYPPSAIYRYLHEQAVMSYSTLSDGALTVIYEMCFPSIRFLGFSVETVNDGSFHAVELVASDQSLSLSIDGGTPKSMSSLSKQSILNIDSPLYLGGKACVCGCVCVHALYSFNCSKSIASENH